MKRKSLLCLMCLLLAAGCSAQTDNSLKAGMAGGISDREVGPEESAKVPEIIIEGYELSGIEEMEPIEFEIIEFKIEEIGEIRNIGVSESGQSSLETDAEEYAEDGVVTLTICNLSNHELTYGEYYMLQVYQDNEWISVEIPDNYGFNDLLHILPPGGTGEMRIPLQIYQLSNEQNLYRIVKEVENETLAVEFYAGSIIACN